MSRAGGRLEPALTEGRSLGRFVTAKWVVLGYAFDGPSFSYDGGEGGSLCIISSQYKFGFCVLLVQGGVDELLLLLTDGGLDMMVS